MEKNYLKEIICENCKTTYDQDFFECPRCKKENSNGNIKSKNNPTLYINFSKLALSLALGFIIIAFFPSVIQAIISLVLSNSYGYSQENITNFLLNGNVNFSISLITYIIVIVIFLIIYKDYLKYIISFYKRYKNIIYGVLFSILMIVISLLYNYLISFIPGINTNDNQELVINAIKDNYVLGFFTVVIFAPLAEELVYRVALFGTLNKINKILAYIVSILLFTVIHINFASSDITSEIIALFSYLISSSFLCFIYDKYSIEGSYIAHMLNNLISYIMLFIL